MVPRRSERSTSATQATAIKARKARIVDLSDGWRGCGRGVRRQVLMTSVLAAAWMTYASDGPTLRSFPDANAMTLLFSGKQSKGLPVLLECA